MSEPDEPDIREKANFGLTAPLTNRMAEKISTFAESNTNEMYSTYKIPKNNGGKRTIEEPDNELKNLQNVIKEIVLYSAKPHKCAIGFIKNNGLVDGIKEHCGKPLVIRTDIKSFFHSTTTDMIKEALEDYLPLFYKALETHYKDGGYKCSVDDFLSIITKDGRLAQGAPSSPAMTNIVCKGLDAAINSYLDTIKNKNTIEINGEETNKYVYNYTRYADDMIISTTDEENGTKILNKFEDIVESHDYKLNDEKTLIMRDSGRQTVLGCVVNDHVNIPKDIRREFRARLHNLKMKLRNNEKPIDDETGEVVNKKILQQIAGKIAHYKDVNSHYGERWEKEFEQIEKLAVEKDYI